MMQLTQSGLGMLPTASMQSLMSGMTLHLPTMTLHALPTGSSLSLVHDSAKLPLERSTTPKIADLRRMAASLAQNAAQGTTLFTDARREACCREASAGSRTASRGAGSPRATCR